MTQSAIISPSALRARLTSPNLILIDTRPSQEVYESEHLPNAVYASLNRDLSSAAAPEADPSRGGRHPLPALTTWTETLGLWGVGPESDVVIYDESDGSNAAARAWWMLRSIGHERVAVVDGGFRALVRDGFVLTSAPPAVVRRPPYPAQAWQAPVFDSQQVDALRRDHDWKVLDVRSGPRFRGETEPIDPVAGHIPGAVNLPFSENMDGDRWKNGDSLRSQYISLLGNTPPERLIVHCGSGVTACHTLLALDAAGLHGAGLYVGSWSEWCRNELPQARET